MSRVKLAIILAMTGILFASLYLYSQLFSHNNKLPISPSSFTSCLTDNETPSFTIIKNLKAPNVGIVTITNKTTSARISSFQINNINSNYHNYEIHKCGFYALREFNYDYTRGTILPGYRVELWKYNYDGTGAKLSETDDFRISSNESFGASLPFLHSPAEPSIYIENLEMLKEVFSLKLSEIAEQNPSIAGDIGFESGGWSEDGRYLWTTTFAEANTLGFIRIDSSDWSYQVFVAPQTTMGGDAFNPNTGMTTYRTNVAPWTGDTRLDQQYKNQSAQSGKVTSFYIYNLLTKKNYLVATTTDPTYYYQPKWLSDTVLQYALPNGATSTHKIK